jgi:hypothetical protein
LWGKTYHFGDDNKTVTRYPVYSSFGKLAVKEVNMGWWIATIVMWFISAA